MGHITLGENTLTAIGQRLFDLKTHRDTTKSLTNKGLVFDVLPGPQQKIQAKTFYLIPGPVIPLFKAPTREFIALIAVDVANQRR